MTIDTQQDSEQAVDVEAISTFRQLKDHWQRTADQLALLEHQARAVAAEKEHEAAQCMEKALTARALERKWEQHLAEEMAKDYPTLTAWETVPADRPGEDSGQTLLFPLTRDLTWDGKQMRRCNRCGQPVRPATDDEIAAANTGRPLPAVDRECPDCRIEAVAEQHTPSLRTLLYPPVAPDAA